MGTKRLDHAAIHAPLKTTFMKEVEEEDESGAKVNTLVFHRFELISPITKEDEANSSSLYNRIKAAGGETFRDWMEPEEGDCAVRIFDLVKLWRGTHPDFDVPNDTYSSMYIYQCMSNESQNLPAPDLKPFLLTPSIYESYEPKEILFRNLKWSDLKIVREVPSTPYKKIIADLKEGKIVALPITANATSEDASKSKEKGSTDAIISSSVPPETRANSNSGDVSIPENFGGTLPRTENVIPPQVPPAPTDAEKSTSAPTFRENKEPPSPTDDGKSTCDAASSNDTGDHFVGVEDDDGFPDIDSDSDVRMSPSRALPPSEKIQNRRFPQSPRKTNAVKMKPPPPVSSCVLIKKPKISKSTHPGGSAIRSGKSFSHYFPEEDQRIFKAILDQNAFVYTKGNRLWKQLERALKNDIYPKRTWQGLRERWRRTIFPAILERDRRFPVSDELYSKVKKMSEEKGTHDTACPKFHFVISD